MKRGFTLYYAVLVGSLLLAVGLAIFSLTFKELVLSSGARESGEALYAADSALECALFWDLKHAGRSDSIFGFYGDTLRSGLVGYWRFEEGAPSSIAVDYSGAGKNGTLTNMDTSAAWVTGHSGLGLHFDGVDDRVVVPDIDYGSAMSGSLWVKFDDVTAQQVLIGQNTNEVQPQMQGSTNGQKFRIRIDTASGADIVDSTTAAQPGVWYNVLWTYDGTDAALYINGTKEGAFVQNTGSGAIKDSNENYAIGSRNVGTLPTHGIIDDVRLYNRVLSPAEIAALYAGTPNNSFNPPAAQKSNAACLGADITDPATGWDAASGWTVSAQSQSAMTIFDVALPNNRCATVTVSKSTASTTIISRGYNTCVLSDPRRLERAIRASY